jgi:hypothetical protein
MFQWPAMMFSKCLNDQSGNAVLLWSRDEQWEKTCWIASKGGSWQDLQDDDKACMQLSYWELILENGQ